MQERSGLYRILEILRLLNEGKKVCIPLLAEHYGVSERTIRRDFALIGEIFGAFMTKEGACYRGYRKVLLEDLLQGSALMTLANIINLFGIASLDAHISQETRALVQNALTIYDFKSRPVESLQTPPFMQTIEHAIIFHKVVKLRYQSANGILAHSFCPYKILFLHENFYLAGENHSRKQFQLLRLTRITHATDTPRTFVPNPEIKTFISRMQTPWATFGKPMHEIKLLASGKIAKYFRMKKYLPSQQTGITHPDGALEITFVVHNVREVEELIIRWLPEMQIIAPAYLRKMIRKKLREKLQAL